MTSGTVDGRPFTLRSRGRVRHHPLGRRPLATDRHRNRNAIFDAVERRK
jgi:hypothetical protein